MRGSRARSRSRGHSTGSSDRSITTSGACRSRTGDLERRLERDAVVLRTAKLLRPADEHGGDHDVVELAEAPADDGRVMLAVDDRHRAPHLRVVTSRSILPVYFSYA